MSFKNLALTALIYIIKEFYITERTMAMNDSVGQNKNDNFTVKYYVIHSYPVHLNTSQDMQKRAYQILKQIILFEI
jgi:hypothetical protein